MQIKAEQAVWEEGIKGGEDICSSGISQVQMVTVKIPVGPNGGQPAAQGAGTGALSDSALPFPMLIQGITGHREAPGSRTGCWDCGWALGVQGLILACLGAGCILR